MSQLSSRLYSKSLRTIRHHKWYRKSLCRLRANLRGRTMILLVRSLVLIFVWASNKKNPTRTKVKARAPTTSSRPLANSRQRPPKRWVNIIWSRVIRNIWRKNDNSILPKSRTLRTTMMMAEHWLAVIYKYRTMLLGINLRRSWGASVWAALVRTISNRCTWSRVPWQRTPSWFKIKMMIKRIPTRLKTD